MSQFLAMGGYGAYVWPAFAVTTAVLLANIIGARRSNRRVRERLLQRLARQSTRKSIP